MRDVMDAIHMWRGEGKKVALATVVSAAIRVPPVMYRPMSTCRFSIVRGSSLREST